MLYCLKADDSGYYIYRCESEGTIKPLSVSWMTDRRWFESAAFVTATSIQAGQRAVDCFVDSSESEFRNFIGGIGPKLAEAERIYVPARGRAMSGEEVLCEMFEALGDDLRRRYDIGSEDSLVIVHPSSIDEATAKRYAQCAGRLGFGSISYLPSWYAGLLAQDEPTAAGDRVLLIDLDTDESTVAAVLVEGNAEEGRRFVPRAVSSREQKSLSIHSAAELLLTELLKGCDTYDIAAVPNRWGKHDYEVLMREAIRCTKQLMRGQQCEFSASGLYYNGFASGYVETECLRPEFLQGFLERGGWYRRINESLRYVLSEAGWESHSVSRVIVTGAAGSAVLPLVRTMFPETVKVTLDDEAQSHAKGALRWVRSGAEVSHCRRIWLCCLAVCGDNNASSVGDRWYYTPLHTSAALQIPCRGVRQIHVVLADAVIKDGAMLSRERHRRLQCIDIPDQEGVSLRIVPTRQGYTYGFQKGHLTVHQETFSLHELWA